MQRRTRQIVLASLLALYGVMTVGGPALHALPGAEHVKVGGTTDGERSNLPSSSHDDCPICHLLSQSQHTDISTHVLSIDVVRIQPADDPPLTFPPAIERSSGPRAPPIV